MSDVMTKIIIAATGGIIVLLVDRLLKLFMTITTNSNHVIIKKKRVIFAIIRYTLIAISVTLLFFMFDLSKELIVFVSIVLMIFSYFVAKDVLFFTFSNLARTIEKERLLQEKAKILSILDTDLKLSSKHVNRLKEIDQLLK
jgi:hypothetical protein